MINIVLIGAGKLGSRHLQALSQINLKDTNIFAVDLNESTLNLAKDRFNEMPKNENITSINYIKDIKDLKIKNIDLALIATTSEHRKIVVEELCRLYDVKNVILEKFLFQDEDSYSEVAKILEKSKTSAWVNCPRREWSFYKDLKKTLANSKILKFDVIGTKWSIATSAIHFIDTISYLIESTDFEISKLNFGNSYVPAYSIITGPRESKYIEFFGSMHGRFADSTFFNFICLEEETTFTINIQTENETYNIYEELGKYYVISNKGSNISVHEKTLEMPYQSQLTNLVAESIISKGECSLTKYTESSKLHISLLKPYLNYLSDMQDKSIKICPIT